MTNHYPNQKIKESVEKYDNENLEKNINIACTKGIITKEQKKILKKLKDKYRNSYSHSIKTRIFGDETLKGFEISNETGFNKIETKISDSPQLHGLFQMLKSKKEAIEYFKEFDGIVRDVLDNFFPLINYIIQPQKTIDSMKIAHKLKLILFFLLLSTSFFSQKFSFIYEAKYRTSKEKPENINTENMILDLENNTSIFRDSMSRNADSLKLINKSGGYIVGVENQFYIKKNIINKKIEKIITYLKANYVLPIDEQLNWKIIPEQKTIGKYKSQKAEVSYGGRNWIAWFTTELPFNDGPYIFNGLPGLIISIEDTEHDYSFNLIQVKKGSNWFDVRTKTIKIDWTQYEQLGKSYYNDPWNTKTAKKVIFTDPQGNEKDMNEMIREAQKSILEENNPLELNHKINYK